jgi:hypothetical protein
MVNLRIFNLIEDGVLPMVAQQIIKFSSLKPHYLPVSVDQEPKPSLPGSFAWGSQAASEISPRL